MEKYYDKKGNADHYNSHRISCLVMSERIWGTKALMMHYEIVVFEYKYRLGQKDSDSLEQEITKIKWYESAIEYLKNRIDEGQEFPGLIGKSHPLPTELIKLLNDKI